MNEPNLPLIDWDKPIETVDGKPARCVCRDLLNATSHSESNLVLVTDVITSHEIVERVDNLGFYRGRHIIRNKRESVTVYVVAWKPAKDGPVEARVSTWRESSEAKVDLLKSSGIERYSVKEVTIEL